MRRLAIDFGQKRIGIAVGDDDAMVASPKPALAAADSLVKCADLIGETARREEAKALVLGIPLDTERTNRSRVSRKLADILRSKGWTVDLVDETLTSAEANSEMANAGLKASIRKDRLDSEAACRILDRFWTDGPSRSFCQTDG